MPAARLVAADVLAALASPRLAMEQAGGWILQLRAARTYCNSTLRDHVRAVGNFVQFVMAEAPALGLDPAQWAPRMDVSISVD